MIRDVTGRLALKQALRNVEKDARALLDSSPHLSLVIDTKGMLLALNRGGGRPRHGAPGTDRSPDSRPAPGRAGKGGQIPPRESNPHMAENVLHVRPGAHCPLHGLQRGPSTGGRHGRRAYGEFLMKPLSRQELATALRKALRGRR